MLNYELPGGILFHESSNPSCEVVLSDLNHKYNTYSVDIILPPLGSVEPQNRPIIWDADERPS